MASSSRYTLLWLFLLLAGAVGLRGQADGTLRWAFTTGGSIASSPTVGPDGTIYFGSQDNFLYALTPAGALKWRYLTTDDVDSVPAVGPDGTIYFGSWNGRLVALNPNGTRKWDYATGSFIVSSPAIAADGTIYVGSGDFNLHAINADGSPRWKYLTSDWVDSSPAIAGDGTVYFGSWDGTFYALRSDGTLRWSYPTGAEILSSPAIGADGTVYIGSEDKKLYAFSPGGVKLWEFATGGGIESSPVVDADGSVYIASTDGKLYALTSSGGLRWTYTSAGGLVSTPALRSGSLIFGTSVNSIVCLGSTSGSVLWSRATGDWVDSSPLITPDGTIYVGSLDRKLYSLAGNGQATSAGAPWPTFHHDQSRQGQAVASGTPPSIQNQPTSVAVITGAQAAFSVGASGTAPLAFQWFKNGAPIGGATGSTFVIAAVAAGDAGTYAVAVSNSFGSATSGAAVLNVVAPVPPAFTSQPSSQTAKTGDSVIFSVTASGIPGPTFQWQKNGMNITGAIGSSYTIASASPGDAGTYSVVATNFVGSATSDLATLIVFGLANDFNGDGKPDILLENAITGQRVLWLMGGPNNAYVTAGVDLGFLDPAWHIIGTADFNGDGRPDILLENTGSGQRVLWLMGGPSNQFVTAGIDLGFLDPVWHIVGLADFNLDGKPDILLENTGSGQRVLWLMGGPNSEYVTVGLDLGFLDPVWHIVALTDFNGDGKPDILLENATSGQRVLWLMGGPNNAYVTLGVDLGFLDPAWHIVTATDFNADGHPDILLENTGSGQRVLWLMGGPNSEYVTVGLDLGFLDPAWHIVN